MDGNILTDKVESTELYALGGFSVDLVLRF